MRRRQLPLALALAGLVVATVSVAVKPGESLFIKARNTKLFESAAPTAKVLAVLQPGEQVLWKGADPKSKRWHRVVAGKKEGVVFQSNLSPTRPSLELTTRGGGAEVDAQAFASSGAATKALADGPVAYGEKKQWGEAVKDLLVLEALAKKITPEDLNAHARRAGIFPVVGEKP